MGLRTRVDGVTAAAASPRQVVRVPASVPGDLGEREAEAAASGGSASGRHGWASPSVTIALDAGWEQRRQASVGGGMPLGAAGVGPVPFSIKNVRIHHDDRAAALCHDVGASAFTYGRDIYVGRGHFAPASRDGQRLLAHELAHVEQQGDAPFLQRTLTHTVQPGEGLLAIARHYHVTVQALATANNLAPNATLALGQVLTLPTVNHTVAASDTLYSISRHYGVTVADLQAVNGLGTSTALRLGQVLLIDVPAAGVAPAPAVTPAVTHTVVVNDTLYSLSQQYNVTVQDLQQANRLTGSGIRLGQVLIIPPVGAPAAPVPANPPVANPPVANPPVANPPVVNPPARGHLPGATQLVGEMRERSFLRQQNRSSMMMLNGQRLFFERDEDVEMLRVHPTDREWIEVRGPAYQATVPPTRLAQPQTGWIRRAWTTMTVGLYRDLSITDRSDALGGLAQSPLTSIDNIVLHRTGGTSQASTLSAYEGRIRTGSTIGAQYLIGETGEISLITPADRRTSHVVPNLPGAPFPGVTNATSIGIEHVGAFVSVTPVPHPPGASASAATRRTWTSQMAALRTELSHIALSTPLRDRLAALTDRQLWQVMRDNRWNIYPDINAQQRRAARNLTNQLLADFNLGATDIHAHELVGMKTLGEGENIRDFLVAADAYAGQVATLRAHATARADLRRSTVFMNVLTFEESAVVALRADATAAENTALAAERRAAAATPGPATTRENLRVRFYQLFWPRVGQLGSLLRLTGAAPSAANLAQVETLARAWRR